jgi:hypothetical protein
MKRLNPGARIGQFYVHKQNKRGLKRLLAENFGFIGRSNDQI